MLPTPVGPSTNTFSCALVQESAWVGTLNDHQRLPLTKIIVERLPSVI